MTKPTERNSRSAAVSAREAAAAAAASGNNRAASIGALEPNRTKPDIFAALASSPLVGPVIGTHADLVRRYHEANTALRAHRETEGQARALDAASLRDAMRDDLDDPGTPAHDAWAERERLLSRRCDGLRSAVEDAFRDVVRAIEDADKDLREDAHAAADAARQKASKAAEALASALDEVDRASVSLNILDGVAVRGLNVKVKVYTPPVLVGNLRAADLVALLSAYDPTTGPVVRGLA
jgi:hypothetical protein